MQSLLYLWGILFTKDSAICGPFYAYIYIYIYIYISIYLPQKGPSKSEPATDVSFAVRAMYSGTNRGPRGLSPLSLPAGP